MIKPLKSMWCPEAGAFALDGTVYIERLDGRRDSGTCVHWDGAKCRILAQTCRGNERQTLTEERR